MSTQDTGGPAFPSRGSMGEVAFEGMTLRDYFAAEAMKVVPEQTAYNMAANESHERYVARRAYAMADAMLKARSA